ncbi:hypothetical protein DEU56DRAFT_928932 [Suillus clintonianus]|uniref:uncharacterized protein n=1 Tax=Suillus clintonianus TaxID=1904413 RepID=UPI001B87D203|nr:uncharacterized protein DEU56DRAFT_928932 [Suillus clintonianus]KAG2119414.1 hypothetical protein DEU56DRAFT_928932 [Suillus clintonianus]
MDSSLTCLLSYSSSGFSVLMFIGTIWALTYKRRVKDVNRLIAAVAIMLLILSTAHMIVDIIRLEDGLVKYRDTFPDGPAAFFADVSQITYVVKNAIYILHTLLGDGVVIYRCYVVWQSVRIIILPSLLWGCSAFTGFSAVYSVSQATSNAGNIFTKATGQTFFALTLSTNLISSGLLAYRIWKMERNISSVRTSNRTLTPILRVLVDAAILYSVVLFPTLVCFILSNNGQYVMLDMLMPIISIAFYMVLIRVAINKNAHNLLSTTFHSGTTSETAREDSQQHPMKPLQVHISQFTQSDDTVTHDVGLEDLSSTCGVVTVEEPSGAV